VRDGRERHLEPTLGALAVRRRHRVDRKRQGLGVEGQRLQVDVDLTLTCRLRR
jgi:hypothetical protein